MDDTRSGSGPTSTRTTHPREDPAPPALLRRRRPGYLPIGATVAVAGLLLTVSACAGSSNDNAGGDSPASKSLNGVALRPALGQDYASARDGVTSSLQASGAAVPRQPAAPGGHGTALRGISAAALDRQQIKTAHLGLRSRTIQSVTSNIESVADSEGGFVASENIVTNVHGIAVSSTVTVRVPVANFDTAISDLARLGKVYDRRITTQDVTGRVADVDSRVTSAKASIAELRVLFSHATKLSDIITLESELSEREADLEALLAQQRALDNQTSLSTISLQVTRPPVVKTTTVVKHDDSNGFVGGIKQGWDALTSTFVAVSHGLGAALPLGLTLIVIAALLWAGLRRLPKRRVETPHADTSG
jgi:hypothetical protein